MSNPRDRLRRILAEEQRRGYRDDTVTGGLDAFLSRMSAGEDRELRRALLVLPPEGYRGLTPGKRRDWADLALGHAARTRSVAAEGPGHGTRLPPPNPGRRASRPAASRRRVSGPARVAPSQVALETPVEGLPGIRSDIAKKLASLGVRTLRDLLLFFPHRHADYAEMHSIGALRPGEDTTVVGEVWSAAEAQIGRRMKGTEAVVADETGTLRVVWFNQPWIAKQLRTGQRIVLSGRASAFRGRLVMESPE
ncbi:MAG TPA: OB-fold nucleic acid binding domain-containing protein, partial [Dehalococcoidia bacterium]|nr:OB-fold nucleic acid binding domain-containing protein [Dehalococcoidia bacterium]